jgi:hypothetical protein
MEATLRFYMKEKPERAIQLINPIIKEVKKMNGELITLWHNESISNWREWKGWQNLYEEVVKIAYKKN